METLEMLGDKTHREMLGELLESRRPMGSGMFRANRAVGRRHNLSDLLSPPHLQPDSNTETPGV